MKMSDPYDFEVIIADDQPLILDKFGRFLREDHKLTVLTASTSEEAILCVERISKHAIVLLDRMFKNKKGEIVLGEHLIQELRIRARFPIIVIFHSDDTSSSARMAAINNGAYWYVPKGDIESLVSHIWLAASFLQQLSDPNIDVLTGALHRRPAMAQVIRELNRAERLGSTIACIMVDLDKFKQINDRYGHPTGDRVLKAAAEALQEHLRPTDLLCRYGGDEFLIFLFDMEESETLVKIEEIRNAINKKRILVNNSFPEKGEIALKASAGGVILGPEKIRQAIKGHLNGDSSNKVQSSIFSVLLTDLIATADQVMYSIKQSGM